MKLNLNRKEYASPQEKRKDFWIGFGLFWALNILLQTFLPLLLAGLTQLGLVFGLSETATPVLIGLIALLPWIINIGLLIYLAMTRTQMALGMLAAFGVALILVFLLFALLLIACYAGYSSIGGLP